MGLNWTMSLKKIITGLLWLGAIFYLFEFFLHFWGLPVLEHDKIFLPTHDRYIALFALTYGASLILISSNLKKYRHLLYLTLTGIFLSFLNGLWISFHGGYAPLFEVAALDQNLSVIGYSVLLWLTSLIILGQQYYHKAKNKGET